MKAVALILLLIFTTASALRAEDFTQAETIFKDLLSAQVAKDYDAFVSDATTELKAALTKTQFDASSDLISARLASGYEITTLGDLNMKGYEVYLFRIRFKDGTDDMLGTLSLKEGKVAGIYFK